MFSHQKFLKRSRKSTRNRLSEMKTSITRQMKKDTSYKQRNATSSICCRSEQNGFYSTTKSFTSCFAEEHRIMEAVYHHDCIILCGETGSGKQHKFLNSCTRPGLVIYCTTCIRNDWCDSTKKWQLCQWQKE